MNNLGFDLGSSAIRIVNNGKFQESIEFESLTIEDRRKSIIGKGKIGVMGQFQQFINPIIRKYYKRRLLVFGPQFDILCSVTAGDNQVQYKGIRDCFMFQGASLIYLMYDCYLNSIGLGIDYQKSKGHMIIDFGAGKTSLNTIFEGKVIAHDNLEVSGHSIEESIFQKVLIESGVDLSIPKIKEIISTNSQTIDFGNGKTISSELINETIQIELDLLLKKIDMHFYDLDTTLQDEIKRNGIFVCGGTKGQNNFLELLKEKYPLNPKSYLKENWIVKGIEKVQKDFPKYYLDLIR
jgi:actin-like ATPase involved in cell morphogenesis